MTRAMIYFLKSSSYKCDLVNPDGTYSDNVLMAKFIDCDGYPYWIGYKLLNLIARNMGVLSSYICNTFGSVLEKPNCEVSFKYFVFIDAERIEAVNCKLNKSVSIPFHDIEKHGIVKATEALEAVETA